MLNPMPTQTSRNIARRELVMTSCVDIGFVLGLVGVVYLIVYKIKYLDI